MGEAKRRGTFEERKQQAIEAGRIKNKPIEKQEESVITEENEKTDDFVVPESYSSVIG